MVARCDQPRIGQSGAARRRDGPLAARQGLLTALRLFEDTRHRPGRVDYAHGVIRGVKILGLESQNGIDDMPDVERRIYTRRSLEAAMHLYEGVGVNVNHPSRPNEQRDSDDGFGTLRNIRLEEDGLYGDLVFLKTHPMAKRVCEAAECMPHLFGLSHNADARGEQRGDAFVVSEITTVRSVDLVRDPATTKGLFESRKHGGTMKRKKPLYEMEDDDEDVSLMDDDDALAGADDADVGMDDDAGMDDMDEAPPEDEVVDTEVVADDDMGEEDYTAHLGRMIVAIIDDDTLTPKQKREKVLTALDLLEDEEEAAPPGGPLPVGEEEDEEKDEDVEEECDDEDKKMKESLTTLARKRPDVRALVEQLDRYQIKDRLSKKRTFILRLFEHVKLPKEARSKVFVSQLMESDRKTIRRLVEDRKALVMSKRPRSFGSGRSDMDDDTFVRTLRDDDDEE